MRYYRLIFRKNEHGVVEWTDIVENEMSDADFQETQWDKPIIRQVSDGHIHYISLDRNFLDAMILGIHTYVDLSNAQSTKEVVK